MNNTTHTLHDVFSSKHTWAKGAKILLSLLLFYLFGPAVLHALKPFPRDERPWLATREGAWMMLAWYLPAWLFFSSLTHLWLSLFTIIAHLIHVPLLALPGDTSFWPLTYSNLFWRWLVVLPATGMVAYLSHPSAQPPHNIPSSQPSRRILTPEETQQLADRRATEEKKRLQAEQRRIRRATAPSTSKKAPSPRVTTAQRSSSTKVTSVAPNGSLWDSIDWTQVPDDHPAKVAAMQEAQRTRWLTQQGQQQGLLPTPSSLPPASPTSSAPQDDDEDEGDYDWSQGEGTVQDS